MGNVVGKKIFMVQSYKIILRLKSEKGASPSFSSVLGVQSFVGEQATTTTLGSIYVIAPPPYTLTPLSAIGLRPKQDSKAVNTLVVHL